MMPTQSNTRKARLEESIDSDDSPCPISGSFFTEFYSFLEEEEVKEISEKKTTSRDKQKTKFKSSKKTFWVHYIPCQRTHIILKLLQTLLQSLEPGLTS